MKTILRTLSLLPLTLLAVSAAVVPVQAQSMQNGQTMSQDSTTNSPNRVGIDASDPYSEQVYSGSQDTEMNTEMNNVRTPDSQLSISSDMSDDIRAQQSISQLQQMRYEVLDRRGS